MLTIVYPDNAAFKFILPQYEGVGYGPSVITLLLTHLKGS